MKRTKQIRKGTDKTKPVYQDFYNKTLVSSAKIKGSSIKLFQSSNTLVLNHAKNDSPLPTKKGNVIVMHARILGPSYGALQFDAANLNLMDALEAFINTYEMEFKIGNDTIHEDVLSTLLEPMPIVFKTTDVGTANNVIRPPVQAVPRKAESVWMKRSGQLIIPFEKPIPVKDEVFSLELRPMENASTVDAAVQEYIIQFKIGAENHYSQNRVER